MREIKFRQPVWANGTIFKWHFWGFKDGLYQHPVNQHESYEYTGINDINGNEIYEGDIVEWSIFPHNNEERVKDYIEFSNGVFKCSNRTEILGIKAPHVCLVVIGNIYKDQELITE